MSEQKKPIRTFIALDIGNELRRSLGEVQQELRSCYDAGEVTRTTIKWTRPESIHLTLRFLGNIEPERVADLDGILSKVGQAARVFEAEVKGLGAFPNLDRPRVIWAGITSGSQELSAIAEVLEKELQIAGFGPADKPFRPHLTLGRVKSMRRDSPLKGRIQALSEKPLGRFKIENIRLYRSQLHREGAIYTVLAGRPFMDCR